MKTRSDFEISLYVPQLIVMRGIPGSGKSTKAASIKKTCEEMRVSCDVFSADHFFELAGKYDPQFLELAHDWCYLRAHQALVDESTVVIIDNTNLERWEMKKYAILSKKFSRSMRFIEPETDWKYDPVICAEKGQNVKDLERLRSMAESFEKLTETFIHPEDWDQSHEMNLILASVESQYDLNGVFNIEALVTENSQGEVEKWNEITGHYGEPLRFRTWGKASEYLDQIKDKVGTGIKNLRVGRIDIETS